MCGAQHPNRSVLGSAQERWLTEELARSRARWNLIAQQTLMAQVDQKPEEVCGADAEGELSWSEWA
jgi:alkaline phosphatase D